jgi:hypothetical protein
MQIRLQIGDTTFLALHDSGSTHNLISEAVAASTSLPLQHRGRVKVTLANRERVPCLGMLRQAAFSVDNESFIANLFILPLAGYDIVLGTRWLASLGPILWDFDSHTMSFWHCNHCG